MLKDFRDFCAVSFLYQNILIKQDEIKNKVEENKQKNLDLIERKHIKYQKYHENNTLITEVQST